MEKNIRVLQFSLSENIGGIETFLRNLYKQFDHDEVQFDFVTTYNSPVYESEFLQGCSRIFRVPSAKRIFAYRHALNKLMAENKYDVVHINKNSAADLIPFTAARRAGIPIVIAHAHNTKSTVGKFADILNCINRGKMDKYLTTAFASSNAAAEWMFGKGYCRENKVPILRNGIDISDFSYSEEKREEIRKRLSLSGKLVVGHVGKFSRRKNHDFIIDVFAGIHKKNPDSVLLLVGTGSLMAHVQQKVASLGISDAVMFMGSQNNINDYYQAMDAFLMPSLLEDLPVAAIEAQAAGLPVFVSDTIDSHLEITNTVKWLSLQQPAEIWADMVLNTCECFERKNQDEVLKSAGYDIKEIADKLMKVYKGEK